MTKIHPVRRRSGKGGGEGGRPMERKEVQKEGEET